MREKIVVFTDGGSRGNPGLAGVGVYVVDENGQEIYKEHKFLGVKTNNEAEYLALNLALKYLQGSFKEPFEVVFKLDSKLVVEQMSKHWQIKEKHLLSLADENWKILSLLPHCSYRFQHVPRAENKIADLLANQAMDSATL